MVLLNRRATVRRWLLCLGVFWLGAAVLRSQVGTEYEIKAAFLYRFAGFVEWPKDDHSTRLLLCVVGQDPFGVSLDRLVKDKAVNGRGFLVRRLKPNEPAGDCHILFISASERKHLGSLLEKLRGEPVLTVGDTPGFCESGGAVNLGVADSRVRLEINPGAAERAGLQLNSRLLALGRIVRDNGRVSQ